MSVAPDTRGSATEDRLAAYFDALLIEGGNPLPPPAGSAPPPPRPAAAPAPEAPAATAPRYRLVRALGLTLAIPESAIAELIPAVSVTSPPPGSPAWWAGATRWRECPIPVADPATWLLPPAQRAALTGSPGARIRAAVVVAEGRLAIGCESLAESVPLEPAMVNWRRPEATSARPWLAGTVPGRGWVLVDPAALYEMLAGALA